VARARARNDSGRAAGDGARAAPLAEAVSA
jgi:hypothetical protein